jgi:inner membrane protein
VAGAVVGALAGLLPDCDHPGSTAGRWLRPVAVVLEAVFGHRTVTHTVWFVGAVAVGLTLLAGALKGLLAGYLPRAWPPAWLAFAAGLLGGLSHLALDAVTRSGIKPFAPLEPRRLPAWLTHLHWELESSDPLVNWAATGVLLLGVLRLIF